jgi:hypothetical protein
MRVRVGRSSRVVVCVLFTALAATAAPAAAQTPDIPYGGSTFTSDGPTGTAMSLLRRADGSVRGRVVLGFRCRFFFPNNITRLAGTTSGESFTATGTSKLTRRGRLRITLTGRFSGETATGTLRARANGLKGCRNFERRFLVRTERTPIGAPAGPPPGGTMLAGLTRESRDGLRSPVMVHVSPDREKFSAVWQATLRCGPRAVYTMVNLTPRSAIRSDGTFTRSEKYSSRFADGTTDTFRVTFAGRFLNDGVTGTLRARMQTRKKGRRYFPCDSGTIGWTATAP